jgi:hypothetical protein
VSTRWALRVFVISMEHAYDISKPIHLILRTEGLTKSFLVQEGHNKIFKTASGQVTVKGGKTELPDSTDYESEPEVLSLLRMYEKSK